ncbi:hypothetical protein [Achromobacter spanius]|uniref:hypothetical protein n=1 Tax=Achromobacter spanius TaxID=217203 RepID=UPI0038143BF0
MNNYPSQTDFFPFTQQTPPAAYRGDAAFSWPCKRVVPLNAGAACIATQPSCNAPKISLADAAVAASYSNGQLRNFELIVTKGKHYQLSFSNLFPSVA